jgi:hypothetical protein
MMLSQAISSEIYLPLAYTCRQGSLASVPHQNRSKVRYSAHSEVRPHPSVQADIHET